MTVAYDPLDPEFLADPYPAFARLRENDPVHHRPGDHRAPAFWALSRFDDVWDAVRRPEVFSSASGLTFFEDEIGQLGIPPTIVMMDPPLQTRLRALVGRGFTPKRVTVLEDRGPVDELAPAAAARSGEDGEENDTSEGTSDDTSEGTSGDTSDDGDAAGSSAADAEEAGPAVAPTAADEPAEAPVEPVSDTPATGGDDEERAAG